MIQDKEMGLPADRSILYADGQNVGDIEWLSDGLLPKIDEPYVRLEITEETSRNTCVSLYPSRLKALARKCWSTRISSKTMKNSGYTFEGGPIGEISFPGVWCDGPFTLRLV